MSRRTVVRVAALPDAVRTAARGALNARDADDGALHVRMAENEAAIYVAIRVREDGEGGSTVEVERHLGLQLPFFGWFVRPLVGIGLRRLARHVPVALQAQLAGEPVPPVPSPPGFLPVAAFDSKQASQLASAAAAAALVGFASALFGQLADPVSETFHVSNATLGGALAVTRFGALVAFLVAGFADRRGRRKAVLVGLLLSVTSSAVSAIAPSLVVFTAAQVVQRASVIACVVVLGIIAVEEAPEGARAFAAAMLALAGGFGFSFAVLAVPVADLAPWAWRLAFAAAAASALFIPRIARNLEESRRYVAIEKTSVERGRISEMFDSTYGRRFVLLAVASFLLNAFAAPSSQLTNKFLDDERGFSGGDIALFRTVTTAIPGLIGLLLAGPLSEVRGRRRVMSIGLSIGIATQIVVYLTHGTWLWVANVASTVTGSAGSVALGTVEAEMFPTESRGTSNGGLILTSVAGSALGLLLVGSLSDSIGLGNALAWSGIAALFAAMFILPRLPESARRRLDDVSPTEDE